MQKEVIKTKYGALVWYTTESRIHLYGPSHVTALNTEDELNAQLRAMKTDLGAADNSIFICRSYEEAYEMGDEFFDNCCSENDWYEPDDMCREYGIEPLYEDHIWIAYKSTIDLSDRFFNEDPLNPFEMKVTKASVARLDHRESIDTQLAYLGADEGYLCASMSEALDRVKAWNY